MEKAIPKSYTKEYRIEYRKKYRELKGEKLRENQKKWYENNKEKSHQNTINYQQKLKEAKKFRDKYNNLINKLEDVFTNEKENGENWNEIRDEWRKIHCEKI